MQGENIQKFIAKKQNPVRTKMRPLNFFKKWERHQKWTDGSTDRQRDGRKYGRTDGWTKPQIKCEDASKTLI